MARSAQPGRALRGITAPSALGRMATSEATAITASGATLAGAGRVGPGHAAPGPAAPVHATQGATAGRSSTGQTTTLPAGPEPGAPSLSQALSAAGALSAASAPHGAPRAGSPTTGAPHHFGWCPSGRDAGPGARLSACAAPPGRAGDDSAAAVDHNPAGAAGGSGGWCTGAPVEGHSRVRAARADHHLAIRQTHRGHHRVGRTPCCDHQLGGGTTFDSARRWGTAARRTASCPACAAGPASADALRCRPGAGRHRASHPLGRCRPRDRRCSPVCATLHCGKRGRPRRSTRPATGGPTWC